MGKYLNLSYLDMFLTMMDGKSIEDVIGILKVCLNSYYSIFVLSLNFV